MMGHLQAHRHSKATQPDFVLENVVPVSLVAGTSFVTSHKIRGSCFALCLAPHLSRQQRTGHPSQPHYPALNLFRTCDGI